MKIAQRWIIERKRNVNIKKFGEIVKRDGFTMVWFYNEKKRGEAGLGNRRE